MFKRIGEMFQRRKPQGREQARSPVTVTWEDLTIDTTGIDLDGLLSEWRWLVPEELEPLLISSMGDLFFQSAEGQVLWLDTSAGKIKTIAENAEEFESSAKTEEKALEWFLADLVGAMKAVGQALGKNQCFSYVHPPALGGSYDPSNVEVTDVYVHFGIMGQIHEQCKDLPPGTQITEVRIKGA